MAKTVFNPKQNKTAARKQGGIALNKGKGSNAVGGNAGGNNSNKPIAKP